MGDNEEKLKEQKVVAADGQEQNTEQTKQSGQDEQTPQVQVGQSDQNAPAVQEQKSEQSEQTEQTPVDETAGAIKVTHPASAYKTQRQKDTNAPVGVSLPGQDAVNAQIKKNGGSLTPAELEAVLGQDEYMRQMWRNGFNGNRIVQNYLKGYEYDANEALNQHNLNAGRYSERDEEGRPVGDRVDHYITGTNFGVTKRDMNMIREDLADGNDNAVFDYLTSITGYSFDAPTIDEEFNNLRTQYDEKAAIVAAGEKEGATDEEKAAAEQAKHDMELIVKKANAISDVMQSAGATFDEEKGTWTRKGKITADEILAPKANALSNEDMEYKQQQNNLARKRRWTALADLAASFGDAIKGFNGAPVTARNWQDRYNALDQRSQNLFNMRMAQIEAERNRQHQLNLAQTKQANEDNSVEVAKIKAEADLEKARLNNESAEKRNKNTNDTKIIIADKNNGTKVEIARAKNASDANRDIKKWEAYILKTDKDNQTRLDIAKLRKAHETNIWNLRIAAQANKGNAASVAKNRALEWEGKAYYFQQGSLDMVVSNILSIFEEASANAPEGSQMKKDVRLLLQRFSTDKANFYNNYDLVTKFMRQYSDSLSDDYKDIISNYMTLLNVDVKDLTPASPATPSAPAPAAADSAATTAATTNNVTQAIENAHVRGNG